MNAEELDALPVGRQIRDATDHTWRKRADQRWTLAAMTDPKMWATHFERHNRWAPGDPTYRVLSVKYESELHYSSKEMLLGDSRLLPFELVDQVAIPTGHPPQDVGYDGSPVEWFSDGMAWYKLSIPTVSGANIVTDIIISTIVGEESVVLPATPEGCLRHVTFLAKGATPAEALASMGYSFAEVNR